MLTFYLGPRLKSVVLHLNFKYKTDLFLSLAHFIILSKYLHLLLYYADTEFNLPFHLVGRHLSFYKILVRECFPIHFQNACYPIGGHHAVLPSLLGYEVEQCLGSMCHQIGFFKTLFETHISER